VIRTGRKVAAEAVLAVTSRAVEVVIVGGMPAPPNPGMLHAINNILNAINKPIGRKMNLVDLGAFKFVFIFISLLPIPLVYFVDLI